MTAARVAVFVAALAVTPAAVLAQQNTSPAAAPADDADRDPNLSQPDFTLVNLPTTLRLPRFASAFRVTHRFTRSLAEGDFGDAADDLFGLDNGATIGLEYRFGLMSGLQVGLLRTSSAKTLEFFGQYNVLNQRSGHAVGLGVIASVEGINNFRDEYSGSLGIALSREFGDYGAVYAEPTWVGNSNLFEVLDDDDATFLVGLGARVRIRPTVYVVAEFNPRAGYSPNTHQGSFAIEKRAGGHVFQLNLSNGFGNTPGQLSRGGTSSEDWYLGFNISRKFF